MSNYSRYDKMKDSGIEWLGEIPEHWDLPLLNLIATFISRGNSPSYVENSSIRVINQACIYWEGINLDKVKYQTEEKKLSDLKGQLKEGDILINSTGTGTLGRAGIFNLKGDFIADSHVTIVRLIKNKIKSEYLFYVLQSTFYQDYIYAALVTGATNQIELSRERLKSTLMVLPPLKEQQTIANFLDRETGRLDKLLEKKEHLIELLEEKRQAMISQAVTKGLNPEVELKDSGVEWLGEIPEHWDVSKIKYIIAQKKGAVKTGPFGSHLTSKDMEGSDVKVYNQQNVLENNLQLGENYISTEKYNDLKSFTVFESDILLTTRGTIGKALIVPKGAEKGVLHPCLMRVQVNKTKIMPEFLELIIEDSLFFKDQINYQSNATTIEVIYSDTLKNILIPLPDIKEQKEIIDYINQETAKLDKLIEKIKEQIENLKEYRQALISNAVTGKVKVIHNSQFTMHN